MLLWQLNLEATDKLRVYSVSATAGTTPERLRVYSVSATAGVATDRIRVYSVSAEAGAASGTTISAGPGLAEASGVAALVGIAVTINAGPGEASAAGVAALISSAIKTQSGHVIAAGVKANILINGVLPRNAQGLRKTRYTPGRVPYELAQLSQFLQSEIERITDGLESPFTHQLLEPLAVEPARRSTTQAMVVYADGTNWDPGSGEGIYAFYGSSWKKLG